MTSIGGIDLVLTVPRVAFEPQLILDVVQERWPEGVFQAADADATRPLQGVPGDELAAAREYFIYQDAPSEETWRQDGRTDANGNTMMHFLIRDDPKRPEMVEVTLVIDELTPEMAGVYSSIAHAFGEAAAASGRKGQVRRTDFEAELRAAGSNLSRGEFLALVDEVRETLYPDWTQDELACHPHDALQFCAAVRSRAGVPVPDTVIMKAMLARRKRKQA